MRPRAKRAASRYKGRRKIESMPMNDTPAATQALPTSPDQLLARLEQLGLRTRTVTHPPVFTVEEAKALRGELPGAHIKNLFLRNQKGKMWLVVAEEDRPIDLKALGEALGAGRLSFGSPDRLMTYLGVIPGAVTPFGIVNDTGNLVKVVIDKAILDHDPVNCHPLCNNRTTAISPGDLLAFFAACNHAPDVVDLGSVAPKGGG
jgi:Ala-tRNA(Pro) deacylase